MCPGLVYWEGGQCEEGLECEGRCIGQGGIGCIGGTGEGGLDGDGCGIGCGRVRHVGHGGDCCGGGQGKEGLV